MKRNILSVIFLCTVLLTACTASNAGMESTAPSTLPSTTQVSTETSEPETTAPPTEAPTQPEHSWLYIPGLTVEDVILYFNEVCLDAEFTESGDPSIIQKWTEPIYYSLDGLSTDTDIQVLTAFVEWLNTVDGFPGIYEAEDSTPVNLRIHFTTPEEMTALLGDNFAGCDGGVTFWYIANEIYDADICYDINTDQYTRNSVILEEIYNGLGPVQDTSLRSDSIIYAEYSAPQELTEIDKLLLTLLYHPRIECGMDAAACEAVIRELYY